MAEGEIGARPSPVWYSGQTTVVSQVSQPSSWRTRQDDALGDGLLVREPALAQAGRDVGERGFERHS